MLLLKDPHTRIKLDAYGFNQRPQPLLHNRYTRTGAFVPWRMVFAYSRHKFLTVSLQTRSRNGRSIRKPPCGGFGSGTFTWIQK